jgi:cytidylate kinase
MSELKIVISGLTAAGKSTHGKLLAEALDIPYVSATALLAELVSERTGAPVESRWQPSLDAARGADRSIDDELDRLLRNELMSKASGVFDACLLPWVVSNAGTVNLWIESDLPSRVRKCVVSHWEEAIDLTQATARVQAKDQFTIGRLRDTANATYAPDERFHVVASNSDLIPSAHPEAARSGISLFHPVLLEAVAFAAGVRDEAPDSHRIVRLSRVV